MSNVELSLLGVIAVLALVGMVFAMLGFVTARRGRQDDRLELIDRSIGAIEKRMQDSNRLLREELQLSRAEANQAARALREEVMSQIGSLSEGTLTQAAETAKVQAENLEFFGSSIRNQSAQLFELQRQQHESFEKRVGDVTLSQIHAAEKLRQTLESQLTSLRDENGKRLEAMRATVDEKLQGTLERRLGESFKVVSERLEAVHKGLGEMQTLAVGVGDLKRVLTNVKTRGGWGEVQLGALLEQMLTAGQYVKNAAMVEKSNERVEYAIVLPGKGEGDEVYLPIDAKFPLEDYERLQRYADLGDAEAVEMAIRQLETRLKNSARDISSKYVHPPRTTDFAIMFLPTEGLYAEAIRRPGLAEELQRVHRVVLAGPTTLTAILNSLQMGFRTLAIQKRSSEVWQVLAGVKSEFGKFGEVLANVRKKLQEATNHIDKVEVRSRAINRQLRDVEEMPAPDAVALLNNFEDSFVYDEVADEDEAEPQLGLSRSDAAE